VVIKAPLFPSEQTARVLLKEARAHGRVSHVNVVDILDVCETDAGEPLVVMPLLRGETVRAFLANRVDVATLTAASIGRCVAGALNAANSVGIVHGSLRPDKVFLHREADAEEIVKVLGFRAWAGGDGGSAAWPGRPFEEEARSDEDGDDPDIRSDVLAFGILMFELLTGAPPLRGAPQRALEDAILSKRAGAPAELDHITYEFARLVSRCLHEDLELRPPSVAGLEAMLAHYVKLARVAGATAPRQTRAQSDAAQVVHPVVHHLGAGVEVPVFASVSTDKLGTPRDWASLQLRC
jgi:serine/threonine-protein kinase